MRHTNDFIKPGDLIEWAYVNDNTPVEAGEMLWSSADEKYVPIGSELTHLCVSCDGKIITWLNEKGLFRVRFCLYYRAMNTTNNTMTGRTAQVRVRD